MLYASPLDISVFSPLVITFTIGLTYCYVLTPLSHRALHLAGKGSFVSDLDGHKRTWWVGIR